MLALRPAPGRRGPAGASWQSPATVPRPWALATLGACAAFAVAVALVTTNDVHRLWAVFAASAYTLAAVALLAWRSRGADLAVAISVVGALIAPMTVLIVSGRAQPEVHVISRAATLLVRHGTPYESTAAIAASHNPDAYNPYLPALAVFGVPRAVLGHVPFTDPRIWFCLGFVAMFAAALAVVGVRDVLRWSAFVTATPVVAFGLSVGGTDVPVLGLQCLGLALLWKRPRVVAAALAFGLAAGMKATAWPAFAVAAVLVAARDGRRAVGRFVVGALAMFAAVVGPMALIWPHALVQNTLEFPLGLARVQSRAVSPLPGHLIAETGHPGHLIALALLALAGLAVAASLLIRPPTSVPAATWRLAIGLTVMFTLAPATRFGYYMYPVGLLGWLLVCWLSAPSGASPTPGSLAPSAPRTAATAPSPWRRLLPGGHAQREGAAPAPSPD